MSEIFELKPDNLKDVCKPFDFSNPPFEPIEFAKKMAHTLKHHKGLGIAAPQFGVPYRILAISTDPVFVCFNPKIVDHAEGEVYLDEGCLSYPGLFLKLKRPKAIRTRITLPNGEVVTKIFDGISARVFLHEMDHLDGKLFWENASSLKLKMAIEKANKKYGQNYRLVDFKTKEKEDVEA